LIDMHFALSSACYGEDYREVTVDLSMAFITR